MDININKQLLVIEEKYPRIAFAIKLHWGHDSFDQVINKFLHDTRDGHRQGFPTEVGSALLELSMLHSSMFPKHETDKWSHVDKRG